MISNNASASSASKKTSIFDIPATKAAHEAIIIRLEEELAFHRTAFEEMWSAATGGVVSASEIAVPTAAPTTMPGFQAYEQEPVIPWIDFEGDVPPVREAPEGAELGPLLGIRAQEGAIATVRVSASGEGVHTRWTYDPRTNSLATNDERDLDEDFREGALVALNRTAAPSTIALSTAASSFVSSRTSPTSRATSAPPTFAIAAPAAPSSAPAATPAPATPAPAAAPEVRLSAPRRLRREGAVTQVSTGRRSFFVSTAYAHAELEAYRKPKGVKSTSSHILHGVPPTAVPVASGSNDGKGKKRARDEDDDDDSGLGSEEERPRKRAASDEFDSPTIHMPGNHVRVTLRHPSTAASMTSSSPRRRSPRLQASNN